MSLIGAFLPKFHTRKITHLSEMGNFPETFGAWKYAFLASHFYAASGLGYTEETAWFIIPLKVVFPHSSLDKVNPKTSKQRFFEQLCFY